MTRTVQTNTCWARLTEDIPAAPDAETGVSTTVEILTNDRTDPDSHKVGTWTTHTVEAIHRGGALTFDSDNPEATLNNVLITRTDLGWAVIAVNNGGEGVCCCCRSVEHPDVVLSDGTLTFRLRRLCHPLGPVEETQEHGIVTITIPDTLVLILEDETDLLVFEMLPSWFTAEYHDGTDATDDINPSGSVIFWHKTPSGDPYCPCPVTRMRIEWDVVIPAPTIST